MCHLPEGIWRVKGDLMAFGARNRSIFNEKQKAINFMILKYFWNYYEFKDHLRIVWKCGTELKV